MNAPAVVSVEREVAAPPERVFNAWLDDSQRIPLRCHADDLAGMSGKNCPLGARQIVLGQFRNLAEKLRTCGIVEQPGWKPLGPGQKSLDNGRSHLFRYTYTRAGKTDCGHAIVSMLARVPKLLRSTPAHSIIVMNF